MPAHETKTDKRNSLQCRRESSLPAACSPGSDTGLGAAPGLDRTGIWRIHNTGAFVGMLWSRG